MTYCTVVKFHKVFRLFLLLLTKYILFISFTYQASVLFLFLYPFLQHGVIIKLISLILLL